MVFSELYTRTLPMLRTGIVRRQHDDCDSCIFGIYYTTRFGNKCFALRLNILRRTGVIESKTEPN